MKPGWRTSEFWKNLALILTAMVAIAVSFGWIPAPVADSLTGQITAAVVAVGAVLGAAHSNAGYSASRAKVKETQAFALAHAKR